MFNDKDHLATIIKRHLALPSDFPPPCNCLKCARAQICPCRIKQIGLAVVDFAIVRQHSLGKNLLNSNSYSE